MNDATACLYRSNAFVSLIIKRKKHKSFAGGEDEYLSLAAAILYKAYVMHRFTRHVRVPTEYVNNL